MAYISGKNLNVLSDYFGNHYNSKEQPKKL